MAGTRKFFRIFLASPGDLEEERRVAKRVIDEYNGQLANALGYHVDLVGWEDTLPGVGRPQELINRDLDGCDLFVGMLWKRWGSPPDTGGEFTSGFEEEYVRSMRRFDSERRPQIHLLLKDIDPASLVDPGEQLKRVQSFREQVFNEKKLFAKRFSSISDFEQTLRLCIQGFAIELRDQEETTAALEKGDTRGASSSMQLTSDETEAAADAALPAEGVAFLRTLLTNLKRGKKFKPSSSEVARFRLLSLTMGKQGNDEATLGAHDSNLLFKDRKSLHLSQQEQFGLLDAGLENFKSQNVPVWHWLASLDGFKHQALVIPSIIGSSSCQLGAISAMRLLGEPIRDENALTRDFILDKWLDEDNDRDLRSAALGYLAECGTSADIPRLREELGQNDYQTEKAAVEAILSILEREGADTLFSTLLELRPASVDDKLLSAIFSRSKPPTEVLLEALNQRSSEVRQMAVAELRKRQALPLPTAEKLLADENARVRYEAMQFLISTGRTFSAEEVKSVLVHKSESLPFRGALGLGVGPSLGIDSVGQSLFEEFTRGQLLTLAEADLVAKAQTANLDQDAFIALARKNPSAHREELILALRDKFTARHQAALERLINMFGEQSDMVEKARGLGEFLRRQYTRQALDLIAGEQRAEDLPLVREVLSSGFAGYSSVDLLYFKRLGYWEDIPLIIASLERPAGRRGASLLAQNNDDRYELGAAVIHALGKDRIDELLGIEMPQKLKIVLIRLLTMQGFKSISDTRLNELLRSESAEVRKASALKAIVSFSKKRLADVLEEYHSADQFYYNVIHWLDFGLSVPKREMVRGAVRELANVR